MIAKYAEKIKQDYKKWLINMVYEWLEPYGDYTELLEYLYSRSFYSTVGNDYNRGSDGKELRVRFVEKTDIYDYRDAYNYLTGECNVLEMMAALAIRMEETIMSGYEEYDQTSRWFYEMLTSLRIDDQFGDYYEERIAEMCITAFLEREYEPNGEGGLFTLYSREEDMRDVEIWYQMLWYLNEVVA